MVANNKAIAQSDNIVPTLMRLYESYGYKKFKMRKFEKYDLYLENKSFLRNANIITVTGPNGRLLALKPDITLSIVKNLKKSALPVKYYYNENIYHGDSSSCEIKESTQVGLEYIGDLDIRALAEILLLAAESLSLASENYRIAISHMGIVSAILNSLSVGETDQERIYELISEKNLHGIKDLCESLSLDEKSINLLAGLVTVSGDLASTIENASSLVCSDSARESLEELKALSQIIASFGLSDKFILDFTVMNDVSYYNGLVFQGYISGIPKAVLSGGRYDNLVRRFGCESSAAGFAVSTDLLAEFNYRENEYDYDVLLLYSESCKPEAVLKVQKDFAEKGESCIALSCEPEWLNCKRKIYMSADGSLDNE